MTNAAVPRDVFQVEQANFAAAARLARKGLAHITHLRGGLWHHGRHW
jgi:hypothetical protein